MSQRPFWVSIIQWTLWALVMAGIMGWLGRARMKTTTVDGQVVMTYPLSLLVLMLICVAFSAGLVVLSLVVAAQNTSALATAVFAVALAASLYWLVECCVVRYSLSKDGLGYMSIFTGRRLFRWDELQSLKYAPNMRWFVLKDAQGHVARVSVAMTGLPVFARMLMERARRLDIDSATVPILSQTARGEPPSLWL